MPSTAPLLPLTHMHPYATLREQSTLRLLHGSGPRCSAIQTCSLKKSIVKGRGEFNVPGEKLGDAILHLACQHTHTSAHAAHHEGQEMRRPHSHATPKRQSGRRYVIRFPLEHRSARPSLAPFPVGSPLCTPKGCPAKHPRAKVLRGNKPRETHPL